MGTDASYRGLVFVLTPLKERVRFGIPYGAELDDPEALLDGRGRRHRYIVVARAEDLERPAFSSLLCAAVDAARARGREK